MSEKGGGARRQATRLGGGGGGGGERGGGGRGQGETAEWKERSWGKWKGSGGFGPRPCWTGAAVALSLQHKFHSGFPSPLTPRHTKLSFIRSKMPGIISMGKRRGEPKSDIIYFSRVHLPHKIHHSDFLTILPLSNMLPPGLRAQGSTAKSAAQTLKI